MGLLAKLLAPVSLLLLVPGVLVTAVSIPAGILSLVALAAQLLLQAIWDTAALCTKLATRSVLLVLFPRRRPRNALDDSNAAETMEKLYNRYMLFREELMHLNVSASQGMIRADSSSGEHGIFTRHERPLAKHAPSIKDQQGSAAPPSMPPRKRSHHRAVSK
ncbi:hypothetical protein RI367_007595 [Sorochytrium milnesiophthora]